VSVCRVQLNCCPANKLGGLAKAGGPSLVIAGRPGQKLGGPGPPGPIAGYGPVSNGAIFNDLECTLT